MNFFKLAHARKLAGYSGEMKRGVLISVLLLMFAALAWWLARAASTNPVGIIRVVDSSGKPVAGATITPGYLLGKNCSGMCFYWPDDAPVKKSPTQSDANGLARVPYPRYATERVEASGFNFSVEHPDFSCDWQDRVFSFSPPANATLKDKAMFVWNVFRRRVRRFPEPVVLKRGGIVKISAYKDSKEHLLPDIQVEFAASWMRKAGYWTSDGKGWFTNRRVHEGTNALRVIYLPSNGPPCFSERVVFQSIPGKTNEFCVQVKTGFGFSGRLDDSVPRPVMNGRLMVCVASPSSTNWVPEYVTWKARRTINTDGTFEFESLPTGELNVVATCDGYILKKGAKFRSLDSWEPQAFDFTNDLNGSVLAMESTTVCELKVMDNQDSPLSGAEVDFWPHASWPGGDGLIGWLQDDEEVWRAGKDIDWRDTTADWPTNYMAKTDRNGIALVSNLPPCKPYFIVRYPNYEMPINPEDNWRQAQADLTTEGTNHIKIRMEIKGTHFIRSPK